MCACVCACACVRVVYACVTVLCFILGWGGGYRFRELLLQSSESEENSETILCALDPLLEKLSSSEPQLREKNPEAGLAAAQLCSWVQGMIRWEE